MLFFPVGDTDITTSTLFPQRLQSFAEFLDSALAETSVFDFAFPAITVSLLSSYNFPQENHTNSLCIFAAQYSSLMKFL